MPTRSEIDKILIQHFPWREWNPANGDDLANGLALCFMLGYGHALAHAMTQLAIKRLDCVDERWAGQA